MSSKVGYARVSTKGQALAGQVDALTKAGCDKIFREKQSGSQAAKRPVLEEALNYIRDGDTLIITKLDRLARSVYDLHRIAQILKDKGAGFVVLDQPEINTTSKYGNLVFSILGAVSELERDLILERTAEGRERAKAAGKHMGRYPTLDDTQVAKLKKEFPRWKGSAAELGNKYGISRASVYRLVAAA